MSRKVSTPPRRLPRSSRRAEAESMTSTFSPRRLVRTASREMMSPEFMATRKGHSRPHMLLFSTSPQ